MPMKSKHAGFTMMELLTVILIVTILACAAVPLMKGKIDRSKWTEANAGAATIRTAVMTYFMETGNTITGNLSNASLQQALHMSDEDINGSYFVSSDYQIDSVNADGLAVITVTGSQTNAPSGSKTLSLDGSFE